MTLLQALTVSLALHLGITLATMLLEDGPGRAQDLVPIEITYKAVDEMTQNRQFVTDPDNTEIEKVIENLQKQADFLSKTTQRVREQTIARSSGETKNQNASSEQRPPTASDFKPLRSRAFAKEILTGTNSNEERPSITSRPDEQAANHVVLNQSTLSEFIPSVKEGGFTSLNTDQFLYYTFYARINEQIRNRWVNNLREFTRKSPPQKLNRLAQKPQITEVEILLDSQGNYVKSIFHNLSDDPAIDEAARLAFEVAAPFLNPPLEVVTKSGYIHLHYSFHIHWRPQFLANDSR